MGRSVRRLMPKHLTHRADSVKEGRYIGGVSEVYRKCIGDVSDQHAVNAGPSPYHPTIIPPCTRSTPAFQYSNLPPSVLRLSRGLPSHQSTNPLIYQSTDRTEC